MAKLIDNAQVLPGHKPGMTVDDAMTTDKSTWEYVSIPEENPLGQGHEAIGLNKLVFTAGKTYHLPSIIANYVKERLRIYQRSCVRLLNSKADLQAQNLIPVGSAQAEVVDATQIQTI